LSQPMDQVLFRLKDITAEEVSWESWPI
jgi:hypothetical protein